MRKSFIETWKWLWSLPAELNIKVALKLAKESCLSRQQSVDKLTERISKVLTAYKLAQNKYDKKQQQAKDIDSKAKSAYQQGDEEKAKLLIKETIFIEQVLPQLAEQVANAKQITEVALNQLKQEQEKLENYNLHIANLQTLSDMNEIMAEIIKFTRYLNIKSARSQFKQTQIDINQRYIQENIVAELSDNPIEAIQANFSQLNIDEEIMRRLQQITQD